jgi:hypothetical protein
MSLWTMVDPSIDDAEARADAVSSSVVIDDDDDDAQGVMVSSTPQCISLMSFW